MNLLIIILKKKLVLCYNKFSSYESDIKTNIKKPISNIN